MKVHVLRFSPGEDPHQKLETFVQDKKIQAAVIISAVGSLTEAHVRYANQPEAKTLKGHFEVVSLSGTLGASSGSHLHISVSDEQGQTRGGHLTKGSKIYTTLEVALAEMPDLAFSRELDPASGYKELSIHSK